MVTAPARVASATARATAMVPASKGLVSNAPIGPFQTTCPAVRTASANCDMLRGPMSRPIQPSGMPPTTTCVSVPASSARPQTWSVGSMMVPPRARASCRMACAFSTMSGSTRLLPVGTPSARRNV